MSAVRVYFAPMEGLTDHVFRRLHHQYFPGVDRYYMPFFSPTQDHVLTNREKRELEYCPEISAVPQILTKNPEDFVWAANTYAAMGYSEVNLNLGCPSGTVFSKGKGAGMLRDPDALDRFLDEIFRNTKPRITVKTRLGVEAPEEFAKLLAIFNRYPIGELTIHPRFRRDFYQGRARMELFDYAVENSKNPLCWNGNLCSREEIREFAERYPGVDAVMAGRGLIGDPAMLCPALRSRERLDDFLTALLESYRGLFGSDRNAMFRMKENWRYLLCLFDGTEKLGKALRKATRVEDYRQITHEILYHLPLRDRLQPDW